MSGDDREARLDEGRRWWTVAAEDVRVARACLGMEPPSTGNAA